ncbi:hypothetical protein Caci_2502 [Catenulispora acidiphila DSM 44928]|uniref:Uncharacterized protein n=1 Tax=Catenulispora acidiphila (strain DSM 44928 / JCM 14897 / NBRC 102108 / NRRL B-24433 / ID139908) TaxID=479433 RepID=C7PXG7_CATAD|nr:hypothetical protein Caci_2502 [Catenulispora acidiphila DSM 44928]
MRPTPIGMTAGLALSEGVISLSSPALQPIPHLFLRHRPQHTVTCGTPRPRRQHRLKPIKNLIQLHRRLMAVDISTSKQLPPMQQPPIPRKHHPLLPSRPGRQRRIPHIRSLIRGINPQHPQPPRQRPQMNVQQKPQRPPNPLRKTQLPHLHPLPTHRHMPNPHNPPINHQLPNLNQRHPQSLHNMPQTRHAISRNPSPHPTVSRRHKDMQPRVERNTDLHFRHPASMPAPRSRDHWIASRGSRPTPPQHQPHATVQPPGSAANGTPLLLAAQRATMQPPGSAADAHPAASGHSPRHDPTDRHCC